MDDLEEAGRPLIPDVLWRLVVASGIGLIALAALLLSLVASYAQVCPTAPPGTSNNQCASTAFVQSAIPAFGVVVGTTTVGNGTSGRVLYDNAGVLGEYAITGTGNAVLSASPTFSGTIGGSNILPLTGLAQIGANTMLGNWTGSTANVLANSMPSCPDSAGNHLNYVSGTGITCGTSVPSSNAITALTGDVTATGPGSVAATLATAQPGAHTWALGQTFASAMTYGGVTLSNSVTGTGSMVLSAAPTITGNVTVQGVTSTGATGTGAFVFGTSPSISGLTVTGSFTATGLVGNASLANPSTTVNGQTCTLGSTCTITAVAGTITVGTTTVASGTTTRILYDNSGTLGEYTISGSGTVVAMQTSPALITPALGVATGTSVAIGGCTIGANAFCVTGSSSLAATTIGAALTYGGVTLSNAVTGTGSMVLATTPTLTTPVLGVATATSINGNTFTTGTYTLTGAAGKTLTFSNSLTLAGTDSTTMTFPSVSATIPRVVASGAKALATSAISSAACTSAQTDTATGTLTTDAIIVSFNADPTAVTGYVPLTSGMLAIIYYPTADTVNFKICNNTGSSITPGAITINWRVIR